MEQKAIAESTFKTFPGDRPKALTFSFDDGVEQDRTLTGQFRKFGLQGTFNLNSCLTGTSGMHKRLGVFVTRLGNDEIAHLYDGFEVASHAVHHPHLEGMSPEEIRDETVGDRDALEALTGQKVSGFAYPFGTFDETVKKVLHREGFLYARTVRSTDSFGIPEDLLEWNPTCHFAAENVFELAERFLAAAPEDGPQLFYIWGHGYELDALRCREQTERLFQMLAGRDDVWYASNGEIARFLTARREAGRRN